MIVRIVSLDFVIQMLQALLTYPKMETGSWQIQPMRKDKGPRGLNTYMYGKLISACQHRPKGDTGYDCDGYSP